MATSELQVSLPCECGGSVTARARDAGGSIRCNCGRNVSVPRLSELRQLSGADPFITNPVEAIRKAQRAGIDPAGDKCLLCGVERPVFYELNAVCEQSHVKKSNSGDSGGLLRWFVLPFIANVLISLQKQDETIDRRGHDVEVTFRLPVCDLCTSTSGSPTRDSVARQLMLLVPAYKDLLDYYPRLVLSTKRG
jgi:hypothetical protein